MKYFTMEELLHSGRAQVLKIRNKAATWARQKEVEENLEALVDNVLDPLRDMYGHAIMVTSGFRSKQVNESVGGAKNSQHMKGEAADITAGDPELNRKVFDLIYQFLPYDQLIDEEHYSWIHVSYRADGKNRGQVLRIAKRGK